MTTQPWLLLSSRPIEQLQRAQLSLPASAFHGYASAWSVLPNGNRTDELGRPCTRLTVGDDNIIDVQSNRLTVISSSRNVTPLYWRADHLGNFVIASDLLIAASAWVSLTDCRLGVREDAGVYLGECSSIHGIFRLPPSSRLEVVLQGERTLVERHETVDSLALQSSRHDNALLAGEDHRIAAKHLI